MTAREALHVYQSKGIVRHPGTQRKADQAWHVLTKALTDKERDDLRSARGCFLDNAGHEAWEFNDACCRVVQRFNLEGIK